MKWISTNPPPEKNDTSVRIPCRSWCLIIKIILYYWLFSRHRAISSMYWTNCTLDIRLNPSGHREPYPRLVNATYNFIKMTFAWPEGKLHSFDLIFGVLLSCWHKDSRTCSVGVSSNLSPLILFKDYNFEYVLHDAWPTKCVHFSLRKTINKSLDHRWNIVRKVTLADLSRHLRQFLSTSSCAWGTLLTGIYIFCL